MPAPQVIDMLQKLNETGCVEFLAEPYSHGLASLVNEDSFAAEVKRQCAKMKEYFGQEPKVLRNSSLIYSDDISLRFSNKEWSGYPLFADNYIDRIASLPNEEKVVNVFMELSALGIAQPLSSNILDFIKALPVCAKAKDINFATPSEVCDQFDSVSGLDVPDTLSWTDEERDVSSWLGNPMQTTP